MRVLVSGSHGLIGGALLPALESAGHRTARLVRGEASAGDVSWDVGKGTLDMEALAGVEAVVHLAGAPVAGRRWNQDYKSEIRDSRVTGTGLLSRALAGLDQPPRVMVSGSAIGWYGSRGSEVLDESSRGGSGFLAGVCRDWEAATAPLEPAGTRVVHLRTGVVQSGRGGALAKQLPLFKVGLGARLGSGRQYVSWISLDDEVGAILHALGDDRLRGPLDATGPDPVTNADYTRALARALGRPTVLAVPAAVLELALGAEMAGDVLLTSQRVVPRRLQETGYQFRHPTLSAALAAALSDGRPAAGPA